MPNHDFFEFVRIAGQNTNHDWQNLKKNILSNPSEENWIKAYEEFLMERLYTRYIHPLTILRENGENKGEGFSIVSIQCALIEFLASFRFGLNYKFIRRGESLGEFEYNKSKQIFVEFLTTAPLFANIFSDKLALDFYENIRCALLHEAMTKNGWRIWASGEEPIDPDSKIVYRDNLQLLIEGYLQWYKTELIASDRIQHAFIRKFDRIYL